MAQRFSDLEWERIHQVMDAHGSQFGLPERRDDSVVIGSFNIRKMGALKNKSSGAWRMLAEIADRFDLLAIQEVQDDLEGLQHVRAELGSEYGIVASDITGQYPGRGAPERLAFLFRWTAVRRTEIASDITFDRSSVVGTLFEHRSAFQGAFEGYAEALEEHEEESARRRADGKRPRTKPVVHLPEFVTFIRQPLCVSFSIPGAPGSQPYEIMAVNAHLLYGKYKDERYWEFQALVRWLVDRAARAHRMYAPNVILLGDCNLDFKNPATRRDAIDAFLRSINDGKLKGKRAKLNFPFLTKHPKQDAVFRTNARLNQTYDQIGLVVHDKRLPLSQLNKKAGTLGPDGFDYGVFNFTDLIAQALYGRPASALDVNERRAMLKQFEHDLTDHMPIWIRLSKPSS